MPHLETIFLISQLITVKCTLPTLKTNTAENLRKTGYIDGEFIIGALFPIHGSPSFSASNYRNPLQCDRIHGQEGIQLVEAAFFAIDAINRDERFLPGIELGITIKDECWNEVVALYQTLKLIESPTSCRKGFVSSTMKTTNGSCSKTKTNNSALIGMIGTTTSASTDQVENLLTLFKIPQIGYSSPSLDLISSFYYSVAPNYYHEAFAIVNILKRFQWNYVSMAYSDENFGISGKLLLQEVVRYLSICVAVSVHIPPPSEEKIYSYAVTEIFKDKKARVVICFCETSTIHNLYVEIRQRNVTGQFLIMGVNDSPISEAVLDGYEDQIQGSLMIKTKRPDLRQFDEYFLKLNIRENKRNPWFEEFWGHQFQCETKNMNLNDPIMSKCTGLDLAILRRENLRIGYKQGPKISHVIKSIYALAHALDQMIKKLCPDTRKNCSYLHPFDPISYVHQLRELNFSFYGEQIDLDFKGSPTIANYDIYNFQKLDNGSFGYVKVSEYYYNINTYENENGEDADLVNSSAFLYFKDIQLPGGNPKFTSSCSHPCPRGQIQVSGGVTDKMCCWSCVPCKQDEIVFNATTCARCPENYWPDVNKSSCIEVPTHYVQWTTCQFYVAKGLSTLGILVTLFTAYVFIKYRNTPVVKSSTRELCYIILIGVLMHHSAIFFTVAEPSTFSCALVRTVPAISATTVYAALLVKTNRIARLLAISKKKFPNLNPRFMTLKAQIILTFILISIQVCLTATFLITDPLSLNKHYSPENVSVYVHCRIPDNYLNLTSFSYNIILIASCTYYAFKTRNIPDNFNEAKFIGFLMYVTCLTHTACCFIYHGSDRKMVSIGISMSVNGFSALFLLFFPKLYIILWAPERNTREHFATATGIRCIMGRKDIISNEQLLKKKFLKNDLKNFQTLNSFQIDSLNANAGETRANMLSNRRL